MWEVTNNCCNRSRDTETSLDLPQLAMFAAVTAFPLAWLLMALPDWIVTRTLPWRCEVVEDDGSKEAANTNGSKHKAEGL